MIDYEKLSKEFNEYLTSKNITVEEISNNITIWSELNAPEKELREAIKRQLNDLKIGVYGSNSLGKAVIQYIGKKEEDFILK